LPRHRDDFCRRAEASNRIILPIDVVGIVVGSVFAGLRY
jgi:hypothetical protein